MCLMGNDQLAISFSIGLHAKLLKFGTVKVMCKTRASQVFKRSKESCKESETKSIKAVDEMPTDLVEREETDHSFAKS